MCLFYVFVLSATRVQFCSSGVWLPNGQVSPTLGAEAVSVEEPFEAVVSSEDEAWVFFKVARKCGINPRKPYHTTTLRR